VSPTSDLTWRLHHYHQDTNMCQYLRLCDNNCDLPGMSPIVDDCVGCRKRKEHEDEEENECKYPKQENSLSFLMRKWSNTSEPEPEIGHQLSVVQAPVIDEKSPTSSTGSSFSWMHRPRHDSFKENHKFEPNNNITEANSAEVTKGRFIISDSYESLSLSDRHRATVPVKSSAKKSKTKQLSKKLSALQSKIETEAEVIQMRMGYRPSHADKMKHEEISDLMQEKEKIKLELKDLNDDTPRKSKSIDRTLEKERDKIIENLAMLRLSVGRPYEIDAMTADQIVDERRDMQSMLNEFEKKHSMPLTKRDKEAMSGLYERYRCVRRLCRRQSNELVPIPEHTSIDLTLASPRPRICTPEPPCDDTTEDDIDEVVTTNANSRARVSSLTGVNDDKWHQMSFHELSQSLGKLKESKKVYKRKINEVESGAASNEHEQSINEVYVLYKATKYKIKLIKALIEKQNK